MALFYERPPPPSLRSASADGAYAAVAKWLDLEEPFLRFLTGSENRRGLYRSFRIPKKRAGEFRVLHAPDDRLRAVQRRLLDALEPHAVPHRCATGFRRAHAGTPRPAPPNIVEHARLHCGRRLVYALDLQDFFPSIGWGRVYGHFRRGPLKASEDVARILANLTTTAEGALPQGAPTSPLLSNLVAWRLDHRLYKWAQKHRCTYSRYADDLAFSTDHRGLPAVLRDQIGGIIAEERFVVHPRKTRLMPYYERQVVTGLILNNETPNVPREYLRALRALLFNVRTFEGGWEAQMNRRPAFSDREAFLAFQERDTSEVPTREARAVLRAQRNEQLLLDPAARIALPSPDRLYASGRLELFQRIVAGRINFVGQVRGFDDVRYLELAEAFEASFDGASAERKRPPALRVRPPKALAKDALDRGYASQSEASRAAARRREAKDWAAEFREARTAGEQGRLLERSQDYFRVLVTRAPELHEIEDLFRREALYSDAERAEGEGPAAALVDGVERFATPSTVTARFCQAFYRDHLFKNLVHSETPDVDVRHALDESRKHFDRFVDHITPGLRRATMALLNEVEDALDDDPGLHPYAHPTHGPNIQAIKEAVRLDFKSGKPGAQPESLHLLFELQKVARGLAKKWKKPGLHVEVLQDPQRTYTDASAVRNGLVVLLESMFKHAPSDGVRLEAVDHRQPG